jgi:tRNA nucleotidyltransferase (CCA-adding enzyme)
MYEIALNLLTKIDELGYVAYIVGGYPRDKYRNENSSDIDICTSMTPDSMKEHFDIIKSFEKYGSMRILYEGYTFEVTTFRKDGIYADKRRPEKVIFVDTLEEDLKRRDFIMNTLCIDKEGNYVDLLGARKDIDNKIIQVVGEVEKKLQEDPLRMIRALRFSASLDFSLSPDIEKFILENKDLIDNISKQYIKRELNHLKTTREKERYVELSKKLLI